MSNRLKGEVSFRAGDDEYTLVFSIDALISLEEIYEKTVAEVGEMLGEGLRMVDLRTVFRVGLAEYHPDLADKDAGRIMSMLGVKDAGALVGRAFASAFGSEEAAKDGPRRPRQRAGTGGSVSTSGSNTPLEAKPPSDA